MVDVDILGLMYFWGLTVDSVSIINLVLAIGRIPPEIQPRSRPRSRASGAVHVPGLSVDYSVHVAHSFVTAAGTKQARHLGECPGECPGAYRCEHVRRSALRRR